MLRIGLISDTHGLLRPEAGQFLRGCDHIVHAGDVGAEIVLSELAEIAPVTAVRGNNDTGSAGPRRFKLPVTAAELTISDDNSFQARIVHLV